MIEAVEQKDIPICAVCNKPVEEFIQHMGVQAGTGHQLTVLIAKCHGKKEIVSFTDMDLMEMTDLQLGKAFTSELHKSCQYSGSFCGDTGCEVHGIGPGPACTDTQQLTEAEDESLNLLPQDTESCPDRRRD